MMQSENINEYGFTEEKSSSWIGSSDSPCLNSEELETFVSLKAARAFNPQAMQDKESVLFSVATVPI